MCKGTCVGSLHVNTSGRVFPPPEALVAGEVHKRRSTGKHQANSMHVEKGGLFGKNIESP